MKTKLSLVLFFIMIFGAANNTFARPFTSEDQGYEILSATRDVVIETDGVTTIHNATQFKVLSEQGISAFSVYKLSFNANTQTLSIDSISVKNPDGVLPINPQNIEEKSLFGGYSGFDETKTKIVPLPNVKIGSEISIAYTLKIFHPPFKGVINNRFMLTYATTVKDYHFKLQLPQSALYELYDPAVMVKKQMVFAEIGDNTVITLDVKDLPGVGTTQENDSLPAESGAWIDVSNIKDFVAAGSLAAQGFEKVLTQPLPLKFSALFGDSPKTALTAGEAKMRLAEILKNIADNFRYFGDWRSVDGGYIPRNLDEVAKTGYGDCKDFTVLVVTAARYLGLQAEAVLTYRGDHPYPSASFPNLSYYNHAIARVHIPNSADFWWLDATNPIPQVGIVPFDIAGRHALVLNDKTGATLIPRDLPAGSTQNIELLIDPAHSPDINYTVSFVKAGQTAWAFQRALLGRSQKQTEEYLTDLLGVTIADAQEFKLLNLVSDYKNGNHVDVAFQLKEKNGASRSGALKILPVFVFSGPHQGIVDTDPNTRQSDLNLYNLRHVHAVQKIKPGTYAEIIGAPSECHVESPWISYARSVATKPEFAITDDYTIKQYRIKNAELKLPEFLKVQKELRDCLRGISIVVK